MKQLKDDGHQLCIYTTSYRSTTYIRCLFWCYGIHLQEIINQNIHDRYFRERQISPYPSKHPGVFGIDLHVDDSEGVKLEAEFYNFKVAIVSGENQNWIQPVLDAVARSDRI